mgnify:CR=1 FL=1
MPHVVDTNRLVLDGVIDRAQATEIASRSRETMVAIVANTVLCAGIIAATFGLIFWLADALAVAVAGALFLSVGAAVLAGGNALYRMLGNAATLVGSGMLVAGAGVELVQSWQDIADVTMTLAGMGIAAIAWAVFAKGPAPLGFTSGAILLMGLAMHLFGLAIFFQEVTGWAKAGLLGYAALLLGGAGYLIDVRFVTALAIVPFAQMLETGTGYFHAAYFFYSPEATLTILQMAGLTAFAVWVSHKAGDRIGRHAGILAIMATVVGNLAFLVGSLWGDHVGVTLFGGRPVWEAGVEWQAWRSQIEAWEAQFFHISEHVFSAVWAILLAGAAFWAAVGNKRGLFNAAMTFGGIHAYTQLFETMSDEPLAWAIGGLAAIPAAWGMWRLNKWLVTRQVAA